jgi:hypothetical protein
MIHSVVGRKIIRIQKEELFVHTEIEKSCSKFSASMDCNEMLDAPPFKSGKPYNA